MYFEQTVTMDHLDRIRRGLNKPGKTQRDLAKAMGIDATGVNRMLKGQRKIKADELSAIYAYLESPDESVSKPLGEPAVVDNTQQSVALETIGRVESVPGTKSFLEQPRDLPILGSVRAGAVGFFLDQGEVQGMARRPPVLQGVKGAFAVYVRDESMFPAFRPGWIVHIHPTRPVKPGDSVVIEQTDGQAFLKDLVRRTAKEVICRQWNPAQEVKYPASKVKSIMLVVASTIEG